MRLYVGNIAWNADKVELHQLFAQYGDVSEVTMMLDHETGKFRGFAFIDMPSRRAGMAAIEGLEGLAFMGRPLRVSEAKPRQPRTFSMMR